MIQNGMCQSICFATLNRRFCCLPKVSRWSVLQIDQRLGVRPENGGEMWYSAVFLGGGSTMYGTILSYGADSILLATRGMVLEQAGYQVISAESFQNALLVLMNHQIDACVLCQSLTEEERRGI